MYLNDINQLKDLDVNKINCWTKKQMALKYFELQED